MTTINAIINSLNFAPAATRIDIWHEGGGIGHWEIMFDNSSGASQILATNYEATDLGINGVVLTKGYVDDVSPNDKDASAVLSKYVKVIGRNYGLSLACLFLIKNYATVKFDDLIADALSAAGSEITFTSPHTGPLVDAVFNKTYLQNGFVDAAKLKNYDFTVLNDKSLQLWSLVSAPSSGVLLKSVAGASDNNILLIDPETKAGVDIRNYIRIDAGMLNDHYTEGNASDYGHVNCSITDDETIFVVGASSLKITFSSTAATKAYLEFPKYNQPYLDFTAKSATAKIWVDRVTTARFFIYLQDDGGNEIIYGIDEDGGMWKKIDFPLGLGTNIKASTVAAKEWHYLSGSSFSWKITRIGLYFPASFAGTGATFWFDGLQIDGVEVWAYASDATSQAAYGVRSIPLTRTDIKSQKQLQSIANTELIVRKDPIFKLNLTCTLQTDLLYSGYTVDVLAPNDYIGSGVTPVTYRILTIHHAAEPGADLCKGHDAITEVELVRHDGGIGADPTRFKLATSPQVAINTRYDQRIDVLEKSITGGQAVTGGNGGNGIVASASLFEVTSKLTVDLLQVFKDSGNVLLYAGGHTTPTNVAFPTGNFINVFASVISPLDHVTVMTDPILFFDQGVLVEKDVQAFGAFMTASDPYKGVGGGAVMFGHGFEDVLDPPRINMTDVGFHELALTAGSSLVGGVWSQTNLDAVLADLRLRVLTSKVATGTAPINVVSTTVCPNLNADLLDGRHSGDFLVNPVPSGGNLKFADSDVLLYRPITGTAANQASLRFQCPVNGAFIIEQTLACNSLLASIATGTAPIAVNSTTMCENLNADMLDGNDSSAFLAVGATAVDSDKVDGLHASSFLGASATAVDSDKVDGHHASDFPILSAGYIPLTGIHFGTGFPDLYATTVLTNKVLEISGTGVIIDGFLNVDSIASTKAIGIAIATGTAPLSITSTTKCTNLNADLLDGLEAVAFLGASAQAVDSDKLDGHHSSEFLTSFNQSAIDANFSSINGVVALKVGTYGSTDLQISLDASYVYFNNMAAKDTYFGTTVGKKVYVQRNLEIGGSLVYNNTTVISNLNAEYLQGNHASAFLGASSTAVDSDKVDGLHSSAFLGASAQAVDSDKVDGVHASSFLGVSATAADSDKVDGYHASSFYKSGDAPSFGNILTSGYLQFGSANQVRAVWVNTSTLELQNASGTAYIGNLNLANIYVAGSIQPLGAQGFINIGTPLHFQANQWTSTVATGTAPFSVASTTVVPNLNADLLDGNHSSAFLAVGATATDSDKVDGHHSSDFITSGGDVQFSSVTGTSATPFKIGIFGGSVYGALAFDASYIYLNAYGSRHIYLGTEANCGVTVQRNLTVGSGVTLVSTAADNFQLFTKTNTANPNWNIGYGNGAGAIDTSKENISSNAGTITLNHANLTVTGKGIFNTNMRIGERGTNWLTVGPDNTPANWVDWYIGAKSLLVYGTAYTNIMKLDNVGKLTTLGSIIVKDASYGSLVLTSQYKAAADATNSEICNDITGYKCLMILGNTSNGGTRKVTVWDDLFVASNMFVNNNLTLSGTLYTGNDLVFTVSGYNVHLQALATNVLAVKDSGGAMAIIEGAYAKVGGIIALETDIYMLNNVRMGSALNIFPSGNNSGNVGGNGSGTNFYWGAVYANYLQYHTSHNAFDALDDLSLVKNYKLKTVKTKGVDQEIIDDASLPFLKNEEGFFEASRSVGFLLGCAKFSALKQDELEQRIADLEQELKKLKGGA